MTEEQRRVLTDPSEYTGKAGEIAQRVKHIDTITWDI
jgi:adenylosuccinate lyase